MAALNTCMLRVNYVIVNAGKLFYSLKHKSATLLFALKIDFNTISPKTTLQFHRYHRINSSEIRVQFNIDINSHNLSGNAFHATGGNR